MRNALNRWITNSAIFLGVSLAASGMASAQAFVTAQRGAEIAPFVTTTLVRPDYGPTNNIGFTGGVDFTRFIRSAFIQPTIELRATIANGQTANEHTYSGGILLAPTFTIHGIRPYAEVLDGYGSITFSHPLPTPYGNGFYTSDSSRVYSYGGGMMFDVHSQWRGRIDVSQQAWNLEPSTLSPLAVSIGISYLIPFHDGKIK